MGEAISGATKTCLEEPRAELTAMFTLKLLFEKASKFCLCFFVVMFPKLIFV